MSGEYYHCSDLLTPWCIGLPRVPWFAQMTGVLIKYYTAGFLLGSVCDASTKLGRLHHLALDCVDRVQIS